MCELDDRKRFYNRVREHKEIQWSQVKDPGNHLDFRVSGIQGMVNWYDDKHQIVLYRGNACVSITNPQNFSHLPEEFVEHSVHPEFRMATRTIINPEEAAEWVVELLRQAAGLNG